MPAKAARSSSGFYATVDQQFYEQIKQENGGKLPPSLVDADGNPRKLTMSPEDRVYRQKWKAIAARARNSKAVPKKSVKSVCVPCAAKAAAAKIRTIRLPSKAQGKPISVPVGPAPVLAQQAKPEPGEAVHPCNLEMLSLAEPMADLSGKPGTRHAQIRQQAEVAHRVTPTPVPSGGAFQITANSTYNSPRKIRVEVNKEALCGGKHPWLSVADSNHSTGNVAQQDTLNFWRQPMEGDGEGELPGFWPLLNSAFSLGSQKFPISADCCGVPARAGGEEVGSLSVDIEVFPGDQYSLEIKLPALLKPESLSYETSNAGWVTGEERKKKEVDESGGTAEAVYKSSPELQDVGSEAEFKQFAEDLTKKKLGIGDEHWNDQIEVKLTQTDGVRTYEAPVQDLIKLVRMILSAEYAFKQIEDWVDNFQVGPGVRLKIECQFLAGKLNAKWGYTEYMDDRVFLAYNGSVQLDLIRASLDASIGWRTAGCADLLIVLKGEGAISISAPEIAKKDPDELPKSSYMKPGGEVKFTGALEGTLFWVIKGSAGLECTFKAETDEFKLLAEDCMLGGKVVIAREPVYATYSYSKGLWGGTVTEKTEVIKGDPHLAEFDLS